MCSKSERVVGDNRQRGRANRAKRPQLFNKFCMRKDFFFAVIFRFPAPREVSERFNLIRQWSGQIEGQMCRLGHYCSENTVEVMPGAHKNHTLLSRQRFKSYSIPGQIFRNIKALQVPGCQCHDGV